MPSSRSPAGLAPWAAGQHPHHNVVNEGNDLESLVVLGLPQRTGSGTTLASTRRSTGMIYIDLPADLNLEDDEDVTRPVWSILSAPEGSLRTRSLTRVVSRDNRLKSAGM